MKEEQTMIDIHIGYSGTCLTIGTVVRQFVIGTESLSIVGCPDTTRYV